MANNSHLLPSDSQYPDLTEKQARFLNAYKELGHPVRAAISAGYAAKSASVEANRLLKNAKILQYVALWQKEKNAKISKEDFVDLALTDYRALDVTEPNKPRFMDIAGKALGYIGAEKIGQNSTINNVQINIDARQLPTPDQWEHIRKVLDCD